MPREENCMMPEMPQIRIHRDGSWTADGAPVRHEKIFRLFHESLQRLPDGSYEIHINDEKCPVEVEYMPFVVRRIRWETTETNDDIFHLHLNTGDTELLDIASLRSDGGNLVCAIRGGRFQALFSKEALSQVSSCLLVTPERELFLVTETAKYPIPKI